MEGMTKMAKFAKKNKEEWVQQSKEKERECTEKIKQIAESYVRDPALIADALAFGSRFYTYSVKNTQLMYAQNPSAMYVQSYPAWKKQGYSVKRGETGMKIFVPVKVTLLDINGDTVKLSDATKQQQEDYHKGKIQGSVITRFKIGTVFDIAQTTFPPEKYPELFCVGYPSEKHDDICEGLIDYCKNFVHCDVKLEDLHSITLRGFYNRNSNEIAINSSLQGTQKLSTFAHELGHAIIHNSWIDTSTSQKELEADALDIMIESGFGLEVTDARKDHLVNHFKAFTKEVEEELGEDFSEAVLSERINDVLSSVFGTYNDIVEDINACVEKYVPHEILIEYEHGRKSEMENVVPIPEYGFDDLEVEL